MYPQVRNCLSAVLESLFPNVDASAVTLESPKDISHGDFATNAALVLAKQVGENPREIAAKIANKLIENPTINTAEIAGPGFININLTTQSTSNFLQQIITDKSIKIPNIGKAQKVMVEFVSINPTGPIHVGHGRNAVLGDTMCNLLNRVGYDVYREYLVNDAGNQILALVLSVHARYLELFGKPLQMPENAYVGEYIIEIAKNLKAKDADKWLNTTKETELMEGLREFCVNSCMDITRTDLKTMGIEFDRFHSEHEMHKAGDPLAEAVVNLREKGYVYDGVLPPPKGKEISDYEPVELTLFKATKFGAERDKAIYNRTGKPTYFGQDIAYHQNKINRGFKRLITVIGVDQQGNFTPLIWALKALTGLENVLHPMYYAMVKTLRDGEPIKLSKRSGNIVALADVLNEVGVDAYRFHMLTRKAETELVFDLSKAVEKSMENPVFYVQYAHARMASVFRQLAELKMPKFDPTNVNMEFLESKEAKSLLRQILIYPNIIERATQAYEPHRLAFYAQDLAAAFHIWYAADKFLLPDDIPATNGRLLLVKAAQIVLQDLMKLIGVSAPEKM